MSWQFWKPVNTVDSVAHRLAAGLRDGSIMLDDPVADEPFNDELASEAVVLYLNIPEGMNDEAILDLVKQFAAEADASDRRRGGHGLRIGKVIISHPSCRVALLPRIQDRNIATG